MLFDGKEKEDQERMELARWVVFNIYTQNPYIKGVKAQSPRQYIRFPWERMTAEEANARQASCHVTPEQMAELDRIIALHQSQISS